MTMMFAAVHEIRLWHIATFAALRWDVAYWGHSGLWAAVRPGCLGSDRPVSTFDRDCMLQ